MQTKWKQSVVLLALSGLLIAATACSGKKPADDSVKASVAATAAASDSQDKYAPKADKTYDISWTYYQTEPMAENAEMKKYWEDLFNVKLKVVNIDYKNYDQIMNLKVASGEIPDKLRVQSNAQMINYYKQGVAIGIPIDTFKKYAPHLWAKMTEMIPQDSMNACCIRDGKVIAITGTGNPMNRDPIVWRGDWLKKVGITKTPDTLQEFEDAMYKFANNDPDGDGKKDTYGLSRSGLTAVFGAYGIPWDFQTNVGGSNNWQVKDGKLVFSLIQPEAKQALTLMHKWYKDGVLDPEFVTGENTGGYWALSHAFINSRIGFTSQGQTYHWSPKMWTTPDDKPGQDIDEMMKVNPEAAKAIVLGDAPIGPNGKRGVWANSVVVAGGVMFGKGLADQPDKIGKLLQILDYPYISDENYQVASSGIKGKMWDYSEKEDIFGHKHKTIKYNEAYKDWNTPNVANKNFANTAMTTITPIVTDTPVYEWAKQIKGDQFHLASELLAPLASESKYKAELTKITERAIIAIITGEKPLDYFEEFVKEWRAAGGTQLEKEANDWYSTK